MACAAMVFGHMTSELLAPAYRGAAYQIWQHARGLTAPTFMFVSGFAFYIATSRHWEEYLRPSPRLWKRARRVMWLFAVGYALHFPSGDGWGVLKGSLSPAARMSWLNVDVLQCVAANLLVLHLLVFLLRTQARLLRLMAVLMPLAFLLSPLVWYWNASHEPSAWNFFLTGDLGPPVGQAVAGQRVENALYSYFPVVPWAGFIYAGCLCGRWHETRLSSGGRPWRWFAAAGLAAQAFGWAIYAPLLHLPGALHYQALQAQTLFLRLGAVLLVFAGVAWASRNVRKVPSWVRLTGTETLNFYWMHLAVLYLSVGDLGLVYRFGGRLGPLECAGAFLAVFACLFACIWLKNRGFILRSSQRQTTGARCR